MALTIGSISVDEDGVATGSGMAFAIFQGAVGALDEEVQAKIAESMAPFCEGVATAIIEHFVANAEITVTIGTGDSGLQRMSNPLAVDVDTQGPAATKTLIGTIE